MSTRNRLTWGPRLPSEIAAQRKTAAAPPANPNEGKVHPADIGDPEMHKYENGDTSSWAEDPHKGPYATADKPAMPMGEGAGEYKHPAAPAGAPNKAASMTKAAAQMKAAKCIRVAQALLGKKATTGMIEDQALEFMTLADNHLASTLRRLEASTLDEETLLRKMLAAEAGEDDVEVDEDEPKKDEEPEAKTASTDRWAQVMDQLAALQSQIAGLKSAGEDADKDPEADDEAKLATMLAEAAAEDAEKAEAEKEPEAVEAGKKAADEAEGDEDKEAEKVLASMLAEGGWDEPAFEPPVLEDESVDFDADGDIDMAPDVAWDPMGVDDGMMPEDDDMLQSIYANLSAKTAGEEAEKEPKADEPKQASKTASLRPQPKKPSVGPKTLGTVRTAGVAGDRDDLSKLWATAPDVSSIFGK